MFRQSVDSQTSVRGVPDIFSSLVDVTKFVADHDRRQAIRETVSSIKLRLDHNLAGAINVTPFMVNVGPSQTFEEGPGKSGLLIDSDWVSDFVDVGKLPTFHRGRDSLGEAADDIELRLDNQLASLVDGAKLVVDDDSGHAL